MSFDPSLLKFVDVCFMFRHQHLVLQTFSAVGLPLIMFSAMRFLLIAATIGVVFSYPNGRLDIVGEFMYW